MRTPLAWRNIVHAKVRSLVALAGISFAILLIFMQLGFHSAARNSAMLVYNGLDFDLLITSPQYMFLSRPRELPLDRLEQLRAIPGVDKVTPIWLGWGEWRNIDTRRGWGMLVIAVDPAQKPFRDDSINSQLDKLTVDDSALIDRVTRPEYGPIDIGKTSEIGRHRLDIVGQYSMGAGFVAGGAVITGDGTFKRLFPETDMKQINFGLVTLKPGVSSGEVVSSMNQLLGKTAHAISRAEIARYEENFWLTEKPIGIMFTSGVLVAFLVGAVILYQVLISEVQNRIKEYATLKALGYGNGFVYGVVVRQAIIFVVLGFVPACLISSILYYLLRTQALLPVFMEWGRTGIVAGLTACMCLGATAFAVRKMRAADPAELF